MAEVVSEAKSDCQKKINKEVAPSAAAGWRTAQPLSDSQIDKLVQLMMGLFQKMVADGPFLVNESHCEPKSISFLFSFCLLKVTLVGISFSGFAAVAAPHQNNSIDKYFGTKSDDGTLLPKKRQKKNPTEKSSQWPERPTLLSLDPINLTEDRKSVV